MYRTCGVITYCQRNHFALANRCAQCWPFVLLPIALYLEQRFALRPMASSDVAFAVSPR